MRWNRVSCGLAYDAVTLPSGLTPTTTLLCGCALSAFIFPLLDPLRSIPGPKSHPVFGVVGRIMKEQTCAPQLEWVEKVGLCCSTLLAASGGWR